MAAGTPQVAQFSVTTGPSAAVAPNPNTSVGQVDVGLYVEDDWRIKPNITLSYGLRFESQNNISDHADWAPRLGFAWGIGGGAKSAPKTVLRAGFGIFYDRLDEDDVLEQDRLNGTGLLSYIVTSPTFYLNVPTLTPSPTISSTFYTQNNRLKAPGLAQTAVSLERQLTKYANLNISYLNTRGWDQFLTNNINSPCPATGGPASCAGAVPFTFPYYLNPGTGTRPLAAANPGNPLYDFSNIYNFQSEGVFRQEPVVYSDHGSRGSERHFVCVLRAELRERRHLWDQQLPVEPEQYRGRLRALVVRRAQPVFPGRLGEDAVGHAVEPLHDRAVRIAVQHHFEPGFDRQRAV